MDLISNLAIGFGVAITPINLLYALIGSLLGAHALAPFLHNGSAASVLDVLYLLFNEGYSAHGGPNLTRAELCGEAIRLAEILAGNPATDLPVVHALLALMLLQASRLPARVSAS